MLIEHAKNEMQIAGLHDKDADYGGELYNAVNELMEVFSKQGHSGSSAAQTIALFTRLARFENLTPLTSKPGEWQDVSEFSSRPMWQSTRNSSVFSTDAGKTWYDLNGKEESK